tara:strand:+ start:181 stop:1341 length:1161 start_codon:yes stop_codon:yes gene_type:complete
MALGQQSDIWESFDLKLIERGGNYRVKSRNKDVLIPGKYKKIKIYQDGYIVGRNKNKEYKIFDIRQGRFFNSKYSFIDSYLLESDRNELFQHGVCQVCIQMNKCGLINPDEKVILPLEYEHIGKYYEGLTYIVQNFKTGYIDTLGRIIIPIEHEFSTERFKNGIVYMVKEGKVGFYNLRGEIIIPFEYDASIYKEFHEGMIALKKNGKYGYIDDKGNVRTKFIYDNAHKFSEGLACVKLNRKIGFIDKNGEIVIPFEYDGSVYQEFHEGRVAVCKEEKSGILKNNLKIGFINIDNEKITEFKYYPFCSRTVSVPLGNGGSARIKTAYADYEFKNGYAKVQNDECKMGLINLKGEVIVPCEYYNIWFDKNGVLMVSDGDKSKKYKSN